jgi:hypothetical protein
VLRSADSGATFSRSASYAASGASHHIDAYLSPSQAYAFYSADRPSDPRFSDQFVAYSTDGGVSFTRTNAATSYNGSDTVPIMTTDTQFAAVSDHVYLANVRSQGSSAINLFVSSDNGQRFTASQFYTPVFGSLGLYAGGLNAYALMDAGNAGSLMWRTTDGGATFASSALPDVTFVGRAVASADRLVVAGGASTSRGLYVSENAAASFAHIDPSVCDNSWNSQYYPLIQGSLTFVAFTTNTMRELKFARAPMDLTDCSGSRTGYIQELDGCHGDLATCQSTNTSCQSTLQTQSAQLSSCTTNLSSCQASLATGAAQLASCQSQATSLQTQLTAAQAALADSDGDGILDSRDRCPKTAAGPVDSDGCNPLQFCAQVNMSSKNGAALCRALDFNNDEPTLSNPGDCVATKTDCIPAP